MPLLIKYLAKRPMRSGHLECPFIGLKPKLAQAHMCMSNIRSIWGRIVCHMVKGREGLSALISQHLSSVTSEQMNLLISEKVSPGYVNKYKCQFHFQNFQIATQVPFKFQALRTKRAAIESWFESQTESNSDKSGTWLWFIHGSAKCLKVDLRGES